jgi:hypothetical protein
MVRSCESDTIAIVNNRMKATKKASGGLPDAFNQTGKVRSYLYLTRTIILDVRKLPAEIVYMYTPDGYELASNRASCRPASL